MVKTHRITSSWLAIGHGTGELPFYNDKENTVYWIDIHGRRLHQCRNVNENEQHSSIAVPDDQQYATGIFCSSSTLFASGRDDIARITWPEKASTVQWETIVSLKPCREEGGPTWDGMRLNEACTDSRGRLWIATGLEGEPTDFPNATSRLFLVDLRTNKVQQVALPLPPSGPGKIVLANSMALSADEKTFYLGCSVAQQVWQWDVDMTVSDPTEMMRNGRVFVTLEAPLLNDGMCLDSEGRAYLAVYNGGAIHVYSPQGDLEEVIHVPTQCPTCPLFVGSQLDHLMITSQAVSESTKQQIDHPECFTEDRGLLYKIHLPGRRGLVKHKVAL